MSNLSEEQYPLLETKEMANRKRELEKLNKTEIIKKLVATEETLKFYSEIITKKDKVINKMSEQLTTPIHSKEWVIKYFEDEIKADLVEKVGGEDE